MSVIIALTLGVVQGLTEFLPVSSSGHLILAQKLFGLQPDLFLNVALHFGTLVAVVVFYKKEVLGLVKRPFSKKGVLVIIATLPTIALAVVYKIFLPESLDGALLPIGFAATFVMLILSGIVGKPRDNLMSMKKSTAVLVGLAQGIAVLPGISRSGSTICFLTMMGVKKKNAVELSFLMSIPVIVGSIVVMGVEVISTKATVDILAVSVGMIVSGVVGYFALRFLKMILGKWDMSSFAWYMIFPFLIACVTL